MKKTKTTSKILEVAEMYGLVGHPLLMSALHQYEIQMKVIDEIEKSLDEMDMTSTKTYIKGNANEYANPLVRELPKHADSANKTMSSILDIITKLGKEAPKKSKLSEMMAE